MLPLRWRNQILGEKMIERLKEELKKVLWIDTREYLLREFLNIPDGWEKSLRMIRIYETGTAKYTHSDEPIPFRLDIEYKKHFTKLVKWVVNQKDEGIAIETRIMEVLKDVNKREISILEMKPMSWHETFAGDVSYHLSNGWIITVFNDCGDWDYIDNIQTCDGLKFEWSKDIAHKMMDVDNFTPDEDAWRMKE